MLKALAMTLLFSAEPFTQEYLASQDSPELRAAVHEVAVETELVSPTDAHFVNPHVDFAYLITSGRELVAEMQGCPRLQDAERFMACRHAEYMEKYRFLLCWRKHLVENEWMYDHLPHYKAAKDEAAYLLLVYDKVTDSVNPMYSYVHRRRCLKILQELLQENYAAGTLPPAVPYWRFEER